MEPSRSTLQLRINVTKCHNLRLKRMCLRLSLFWCLICFLQSCDHLLGKRLTYWLSCVLCFLAFLSISHMVSGSKSGVVLDCIKS